jgi:hypothetical protein
MLAGYDVMDKGASFYRSGLFCLHVLGVGCARWGFTLLARPLPQLVQLLMLFAGERHQRFGFFIGKPFSGVAAKSWSC